MYAIRSYYDPLLAYLPHPVYEIFGEESSRTEARAKLREMDPAMKLGDDARVLLV